MIEVADDQLRFHVEVMPSAVIVKVSPSHE
jgi:hypothetical protein